MAGLFDPSFRGAGSPGAPGVGTTQRGLQLVEQGKGVLESQQLGLQGERDTARINSLIQGAVQLKQIRDPQQKLSFLQNRKVELQQARLPTGDTDEAIQLAQAGDFAALEEITDQAISLGQKPADPFTLSPGQQRFGPGGLVAAVPPSADKDAAGFTLKPGEQRFGPGGAPIAAVAPEQAISREIPSELIIGLPEDVARKGAAAFRAAGGGKDGLEAFNKIVGIGTEAERRAAAPELLRQSFPNASPAELKQLQASVDAAKTTERGLKAAEKVRTEQKRLTKAQGFQDRAVELIDLILGNDELGDVLGAVEGAIDIRFQTSESELIADIEEAKNILTAENMDLMTGVLSESDIKILANLAGGALNRKRTKTRFVKDLSEMKEKLTSKKVTTVNDEASALINTLPPGTVDNGNGTFTLPSGETVELE